MKSHLQISHNMNAFYIHVPYCLSKCSYCSYFRFTTDQQTIDEYMDSKLPTVITNNFERLNKDYFELYIGGGTPTVGSAKQWDKIFNLLPMNRIGLKCMECSDSTITEDHVELWKKWGFKYISMGVQSTRKEILEKQRRKFVEPEKIKKYIQLMDSKDIITNIDLICGLDSADIFDVEPFIENDLLETMLILNPQSITIHLNYQIVDNQRIRMLLINEIKRVLEKYPNWKCVNHLLGTSLNSLNFDYQFNAEYKLMRANYDFLYRQTSGFPKCPGYGWNIENIDARFPRPITQTSFDSERKYEAEEKLVHDVTTDIRLKLGLPYSYIETPPGGPGKRPQIPN